MKTDSVKTYRSTSTHGWTPTGPSNRVPYRLRCDRQGARLHRSVLSTVVGRKTAGPHARHADFLRT
ncbi:hypothetical protein ABTY20_03805 [Streptomyces sp. NPDC126497]|uniref:hypothetical protein n=1 Tax=Streptomyces sp. NPDC126497 TaxID=3155313 RepID=UPI00332EE279